MRAWLSRIENTFRRRRLDDEFDQEVREHLDLLQERFVRNGMTPSDALYAARRQFGGVTQMKEELRERRALPSLDVLAQDVRHAFRQLRKAKWFTASAALTLALGIGASTAVFAVLDTVVLRPLPFPEPERLMGVRSIDRRGSHPTPLSYPTFFDFREQNRVFEQLVSYRDEGFTLTDSVPAIQVPGEIVSWNLFRMLKVPMELGRGFAPDEEKPGTDVVVLSHELWKSRFGADPAILNRRIHISGRLFTVAGVAPAGFRFPVDRPKTGLWTTLAQDAALSEFTPLTRQRGARMLEALGRLKPGVTPAQARAQMDQIAGALAQQYPDESRNVATTAVTPELERLTGSGSKPLWILMGAVGLMLLIACANVANLLLARSTERAREFTLRAAIGASRGALVRQVFLESLTLGLIGAVTGLGVAWGMLKAMLPLVEESIPRIGQTAIDARVMIFSATVVILTSILFSVAPAVQVVRADLAGALKEGALNIARGNHRFRSALVIAQITLGLVLLVGAEVMMASFLHLATRDPGFHADHLLTFDVGLPGQYTVADQIAFHQRLMQRMRAIPGVQAASSGGPLPLEGSQMTVSFDIEERPAAPPDRPRSDMAIVTPGYFPTMGILLLKGRDFREQDDLTAARVLIVNEAFARKFFPGEDVIGKRITPGATNGKEGVRLREIVGVVGNARQEPLGAGADPIYYFPYRQLNWSMGTVVLRTATVPADVESAARAELGALDRQAPMYRVRTGEDLAATALAGPRFQLMLMGSFAGIALLLTTAGLYGVLSYAVARRRREIGVRIALGAGRREVVGMVFRDAMRLVGAGLILGLVGVTAARRLLDSMVFEVRPSDSMVLVAACCLMLVTATIAAWLPASRAASVDPMRALRSE